MSPGVGKGLPKTSKSGEQAGDEDGAAPTKPFVERDNEPAIDEGTAEIWCRVDKTEQPAVAITVTADTKMTSVGNLSTVDDRLV